MPAKNNGEISDKFSTARRETEIIPIACEEKPLPN